MASGCRNVGVVGATLCRVSGVGGVDILHDVSNGPSSSLRGGGKPAGQDSETRTQS